MFKSWAIFAMAEHPSGDPMAETMAGRIVLITGASSGIGLVAAKDLSAAGAHVVMMVRSQERGEAAQEAIAIENKTASTELLLADLSDLASVRSAARDFLGKHDRLDVLIANAGAIYPERSLTVDGNEATLQVNHLAHFLLCQTLEPALAAASPARVVTVSSDAHHAAWRGLRFEDLTAERGWSSFGAYAHSKLANIMFCYEHARRLAGSGISSNVMHPGLVRTGFGSQGYGLFGGLIGRLSPAIAGTAEDGADTLVWLASADDVRDATGVYYHRRHPHRSSRVSLDVEAQKRLWDVSERLTEPFRDG